MRPDAPRGWCAPDSRKEAENYTRYLTTKFVRFLVHQRKSTQDVRLDKFHFVRELDTNKHWTDTRLYRRFGLSREEIDYIEDSIHPREPIMSLGSYASASHLPGGSKYRFGRALKLRRPTRNETQVGRHGPPAPSHWPSLRHQRHLIPPGTR